jgi:purine-binding chemotaxis protein CheW
MREPETPKTSESEVLQFLSFVLGGKVYGLEILNIKEIIEYGDITEVPMMPDFIKGVINLRGSVVPVITLSKRFSGSETEVTKRTSIIIIELSNDSLVFELGLTVDLVNEVLDIDKTEIESAPPMGSQIQTEFIRGMAKVNGKLLVLLDIQHILSVDELSQVGYIHSEKNR